MLFFTRFLLVRSLLALFPLLLACVPESVSAQDQEQGRDIDIELGDFSKCRGSGRITCVVDGDTIWYRGDKIRIADINTPEISRPDCEYEAQLGEQSTNRLIDLLNAGPFSLESDSSDGRDKDHYGRLLRVVTRSGQSLGAILVAEGLAEEWQGRRRDWCISA